MNIACQTIWCVIIIKLRDFFRDTNINKVLLKIIKYRQTNKTVILYRDELIFRRFELPIERASPKIAMLAL